MALSFGVAALVVGGILVLIAIGGSQIKAGGAEIMGQIGPAGRAAAGLLGLSMIAIAVFLSWPRGGSEAANGGSATGQRMTIEADSNLPMNDLLILPNTTIGQCVAACLKDARCQAYTYDDNAERKESYRTCFLKSSAGATQVVAGAVSGVKQ